MYPKNGFFVKISTKIKRVFISVTAALVLLPFVLLLSFNIGPFNSFILSTVSGIFSSKFNTEIRIDNLFINPFTRSVTVHKFFVRDLQRDTLLYVQYLHVNLDDFNIGDKSFYFADVRMNNATVKLKTDSSGNFNFDFLLTSDTSEVKTEDTTAVKFNISVSSINFKNLNFCYVSGPDTLEPYAMNFDNLDLRNINLAAKNFSINDSLQIKLDLNSLSAQEKCGLKLKKLSADVDVSPKGILLDSLLLTTDITNLNSPKLHFVYNGFDDFSYFLDSVRLNAVISDSSKLGLNDIGHFVPDIYGYGISPRISAVVNGPISNFCIRKLEVDYGDSTKLRTSAYLKGLPDMNKFYYRVDTLLFRTTSLDVMTLHDPQNDSIPLLDLPEFLDDFGLIKLYASSRGSLKSLTANAKLNSKLGDVFANVRLTSNSKSRDVVGRIDAGNLDLGAISGDHQTLGKLSANLDSISVKIFNDSHVAGVAHGRVDSVGLLGYYYHNIKLDGDFTDSYFNGGVSIKDPGLDVDFAGTVDISDKMAFDFALDVNNADLKKVNILTDSIDKLKLSLIANFTGNSVDNFNGYVKLSEPLLFQRDNDTLIMKDFNLKSFIDNYTNNFANRKYIINSSFFDAQLLGRIRTEQMQMIANHLAFMIFPTLDYEREVPLKLNRRRRVRYSFDDPEFAQKYDSKFSFSIDLNDSKPLTDFFVPELTLSPDTKIVFDSDVRKGISVVRMTSDLITYNDYSAENLLLTGSAKHDTLDIDLDIAKVTLLDEELLKPHFLFEARHDSADWGFKWTDSESEGGNINGNLFIVKNPVPNTFPLIELGFNNSNFHFMQSEWKISPSTIVMDSTSFDVKNFSLSLSQNEETKQDYDFSINGKISEDPTDKLVVTISDFDISILEKFVPDLTFSGTINGKYSVSQVYAFHHDKFPLIEAHTESKKLNINGIALKNLLSDIKLDNGDSVVNISLFTSNKITDTLKTISALGTYDIKSDYVDLAFDLNDLQLNYFKKFFENYLQTSKYSMLSGRARMIGKIDNPLINAALTLHGGYFKIPYLGTQYDLNDSMAITLDNKMIKLEKTKFYSGRGTGVAYLEGVLTHRNFENFNMDVNLLCKNFMVLNAKETDSSAFWGKAFTSGNIKITGDPTRMINIDARVQTDKNTQVFLPLYLASEVSTDWDFITFKNPNQVTEIHRQKADLSDIRMNFNLQVTPDAEVQVILDETTGNILKASASGHLRLDVSGSGDFNMYGTLDIVKGDYLFTMPSMFSKKFEIVQGGFLRWNGDPMDAIVDLSASYRLRKVNLYNLMVDEQYRDKKVPVRCMLNMKGDLMKPKVSFGVKVEENSDVVQGQLDNLDEGNINKQAMSLLLLNQFQPLPGLRSAENSLFSDINPGELVSNQLNHWLSDISDKVNVGVNYQMGDASTSNEFDLAVSTQLLDDRVTVSTNLGVGGTSVNSPSRTNSVVGEVEVDVNLNKTGNIQLRVYNKANDDELEEAPYVQGVGVIFKREFNHINLFKRKRRKNPAE